MYCRNSRGEMETVMSVGQQNDWVFCPDEMPALPPGASVITKCDRACIVDIESLIGN